MIFPSYVMPSSELAFVFNGPSLQDQGFNEREIEGITASLSHRVNLTPEAREFYADLQKLFPVGIVHISSGNPIIGKIRP